MARKVTSQAQARHGDFVAFNCPPATSATFGNIRGHSQQITATEAI
jgi:hypothetical protein